jgi:hypothetical protein
VADQQPQGTAPPGEHPFTTDGYAHALDLGRLPCAVCGGRFADHPRATPLPGSVAWWRFVAARFPEYEPNVAAAQQRDREALAAARVRLQERYVEVGRVIGEAFTPAFRAAGSALASFAAAFGGTVSPPD